MWVWFPLEEIKCLLFSFLHSGAEAKWGVELRHSTRYACRIRRKVGTGLCCYIYTQYETEKNIYLKCFIVILLTYIPLEVQSLQPLSLQAQLSLQGPSLQESIKRYLIIKFINSIKRNIFRNYTYKYIFLNIYV